MLNFILIFSLTFSLLFFHKKENRKYYEKLDLPFSASEEEIKTAYQKKISELKASKETYKISQVNRAYQILSNRLTKSLYDLDGEEEVRNFETAKAHGYAS